MSNSDDMGDLGNFREDPNAKKEKALSDMDDMGALTSVVEEKQPQRRPRNSPASPAGGGSPPEGAAPGTPPAPGAPASPGGEDEALSRFSEESDELMPIDIGGGGGGAPIPPAELPPAAEPTPAQTKVMGGDVPIDFLPKGNEPEAPKPQMRRLADGTEVPVEVAKHVFDDSKNKLKKGDYVDLLHKVPSLKAMYIACGWSQPPSEEARVDVDVSLFLLDKNGQTRADGDFVFYNQQRACDGAVKHLGDNRAGMGDGDNETVFVDFNGLPFDIMRMTCVVTIYDEKRDGLHFGGITNLYVRIVNKEDNFEVLRMTLADDEIRNHNSVIPFSLIREGPKWFCEGLATLATGGLQEIAKSYGIIVQEDTG
jgi:tellurium resistance protein TerD